LTASQGTSGESLLKSGATGMPWSRRIADLVPIALVAIPALFLLFAFVIPNAFLLSAGFYKSDAQVLTNQLTLENYQLLLGRPLYRNMIYRSFWIGGLVGLLVVTLAYPLAFLLARTTSRWKGLLIALTFSPLLASVVVRTYGWWVLLNADGAFNRFLLALGAIDTPISFLPSSGAIVLGLTHSLLPYGVLTILSSLHGLNPNLERAAASLGAGKVRVFLEVTLPLSWPGVLGGFFLAFALAISAYATPQILGGPATETMATMIYKFMVPMAEWSLGSALSTILVVSAVATLLVGGILGARRQAVA
jgi:putative spermidine/putrescine transport system permease protein